MQGYWERQVKCRKLVHGQGMNLCADALEAAGLEASNTLGVAVHGVAHPCHHLTGVANRLDQPRQISAHLHINSSTSLSAWLQATNDELINTATEVPLSPLSTQHQRPVILLLKPGGLFSALCTT